VALIDRRCTKEWWNTAVDDHDIRSSRTSLGIPSIHAVGGHLWASVTADVPWSSRETFGD
jgi:hypothetical protein